MLDIEVMSTTQSKGRDVKAINAEAVPVNERGSDFVSICFSDRVEKVLSTVALRAKKYAFMVFYSTLEIYKYKETNQIVWSESALRMVQRINKHYHIDIFKPLNLLSNGCTMQPL